MGIAPTHVSPAPLEQRVSGGSQKSTHRRDAPSSAPLLEAAEGGLSERFASAVGDGHPIRVFLVAALAGYALLVGLTIASRLPVDEGHPADRRNRVMGRARQPPARRRTHPDARRSFVGGLDAGGRDRDSDLRRRASCPLSLLPPLAARGFHAVRDLHRVRHVSRHDPSSSIATGLMSTGSRRCP